MLSKLMNDWGDAERKQALLIDVELKEYFRYINELSKIYNINFKAIFLGGISSNKF